MNPRKGRSNAPWFRRALLLGAGFVVLFATAAVAATDEADQCQRTIESQGIRFARRALKVVRSCARGDASISTCLATELPQRMESSRARWARWASRRCEGVDVFKTLGYHATCGVAPSTCTFTTSGVDRPGERNDLIDCLACRIEETIADLGPRLYANDPIENNCQDKIGSGAVRYTRRILQALLKCGLDGRTSIAECLGDPQVSDVLNDKRADWTIKSKQA